MQNGDLVLAHVFLVASLSAGCGDTEGDRSLVTNAGGSPSSSAPVTGDDVESGEARSRISLGALGNWEARPIFYHVHMPESPGHPEEVSLSYSAVFANGDAVSLILPYAGGVAIFDAASLPLGRYGVMWSASSDDMFSTSGTIVVSPTDAGMTVSMSDVVLTPPLRPDDSVAVEEGMIEGQLERRCFLTEKREDGLTGPNGAVLDYVLDPTWSSDFCARQRR